MTKYVVYWTHNGIEHNETFEFMTLAVMKQIQLDIMKIHSVIKVK